MDGLQYHEHMQKISTSSSLLLLLSFLFTIACGSGGSSSSGSGNKQEGEGNSANQAGSGNNNGSGNDGGTGNTAGAGNHSGDDASSGGSGGLDNSGGTGGNVNSEGGNGGDGSPNPGNGGNQGGTGGNDPNQGQAGAMGGNPLTCGNELCNNEDDDCDDAVDEEPEDICPPGAEGQNAICIDGQCVAECEGGGIDCNTDPNLDPICINDFDTNIQHCGECNNLCTGGDCINGQCRYATQIALGSDFSCAVLEGGFLKCWGNNQYGQLGKPVEEDDFDGSFRNIPELMMAVSDLAFPIHEISTGDGFACAIAGESRENVVCWGKNWDNQINDSFSPIVEPQIVRTAQEGQSFQKLITGHHQVCTITNTFTLDCWGGDPRFNGLENNIPWDSEQYGTPIEVTAGKHHTCVITTTTPDNNLENRHIFCWGDNDDGQVGVQPHPRGEPELEPREVMGIQRVGSEAIPIKLQAGENHTCVFMSTPPNLDRGYVRCWGSNEQGQLGYPLAEPFTFSPVDVSEMNGENRIAIAQIDQFESTFFHACFLKNNQTHCFGRNQYSQIGRQSIDMEDFQWLPHQVPALPGFGNQLIQITVGESHSCALLSYEGNNSKSIRCWGSNQYGQLGSITGYENGVPIRGQSARPQPVLWRAP